MAIRSQRRNHARLHRVQAAQLPELRSRSGTRPTASSSRSTAAGAVAIPRTGRPANGPADEAAPAPAASSAGRGRARSRAGAAAGRSVTQRARARQQAVRPSAQPQKSQTGARRVPGSGFRRFVSESWAELKKVEWPTQNQVIQGTVVVIIACVIVGSYLWLADLVFKPLVQQHPPRLVRTADVPLVRHQHLLGAREQGEDQSRAPDRSR